MKFMSRMGIYKWQNYKTHENIYQNLRVTQFERKINIKEINTSKYTCAEWTQTDYRNLL